MYVSCSQIKSYSIISSLANFSKSDFTPFSPKSISAFSLPLTILISNTLPIPKTACFTNEFTGIGLFVIGILTVSVLDSIFDNL